MNTIRIVNQRSKSPDKFEFSDKISIPPSHPTYATVCIAKWFPANKPECLCLQGCRDMQYVIIVVETQTVVRKNLSTGATLNNVYITILSRANPVFFIPNTSQQLSGLSYLPETSALRCKNWLCSVNMFVCYKS